MSKHSAPIKPTEGGPNRTPTDEMARASDRRKKAVEK